MKQAVNMDLEVERSEHGKFSLLAVSGEVDIATAPRLRKQLDELMEMDQTDVVVDLDGIDFLDSTGLGVLVGALKRLRARGGELHLICTQPRIHKVFDLTGPTKMFQIHKTVGDAVAGAAG